MFGALIVQVSDGELCKVHLSFLDFLLRVCSCVRLIRIDCSNFNLNCFLLYILCCILENAILLPMLCVN